MVNRKLADTNNRIALTPSRIGLQYYAEEHLPLVYCAAVMLYILADSNTGQKNYNKVVDVYRKPDISDMIQKLQIVLPTSHYYLNAIMNGAGFIPEFKKKALGPQNIIQRWFDFFGEYRQSEDFKLWYNLIDEMIIAEFNKDRNYPILTAASSPNLVRVISVHTLGKHLNFESYDDKIIRAFKAAGKIDPTTIRRVSQPNSREHRQETQWYKQRGMTGKYDETVLKAAYYWYGSRVLNDGITAFCDSIDYPGEVANVSNLIKPVDEALGYPRQNAK